MRIVITVAAASLLLVSANALAKPIVPDPPPDVEKTEAGFEKARLSSADAEKAYNDGNVAVALTHAAAAYQSYPNSSTAALVAFLLFQQERTERSVEWTLLALGLDPPPLTVEEIEKALVARIAKLDAPIGWLTVKKRPEGAVVTVDGTPVPPRVKVVGLEPGAHTVEATAEGFEAFRQEVRIEASQGADVAIVMTAKTITPSSASSDGSDDVPGWILVGSGAALAIAGGVVLGLSAGVHEELDSLGPTEGDRYNDLRSQRDSMWIAGWVVGGVGLGAVIAGAVLLATSDEGEGEGTVQPVSGGITFDRGGARATATWRF